MVKTTTELPWEVMEETKAFFDTTGKLPHDMEREISCFWNGFKCCLDITRRAAQTNSQKAQAGA